MITCEFENGTNAKLRHVVADVILTKEGQVLLVKRADHSISEAGKWALPGGYVERNETVVEAAKREVREETGYDSTDYQFVEFVDSPKRRNDKPQNIAFVYSAKPLEKKGESDHEIDDQKWFSFASLPPKEQTAFDHLEIIESFSNLNQA